MVTLGFLVNPIAGMGGRVGLKGTDGEEVLRKARELGSEPLSPERAHRTMEVVKRDIGERGIRFFTCGPPMGADVLSAAGFKEGSDFEVVVHPGEITTAEDTKAACRAFIDRGVDLVVFAGGDGTARDVVSAVGKDVPVLGIPSGVKMHSSVFALNPHAASDVILAFGDGTMTSKDAEIMDIDEEAYRGGTLNVKLYDYARTPYNDRLIQTAKAVFRTGDEKDYLKAISRYAVEIIEREDGVHFLGAGSTLRAVCEELDIDHTVLGVDALLVTNGERAIIGSDLNEEQILGIMDQHEGKRFFIVISPIGAQGFIFGRGNQQFSPEVVRRVGVENILMISTPHKLENTPVLYVDTGDDELDEMLSGFRRVIIGYHTMAMRKVLRPGAEE